MAKGSIKVTIEFTEDNLNTLLSMANFSDNEALTVADLSAARFKELKKALQDTPFIDEIMDGSYDAVANDWLCEFGSED